MKFFPSVLFLLGSIHVIAQTGSLKGTVSTSNGKAAPYVNISIKETGKGTTSSAIQNVLLGATALGIATYWGSGGMAQHQAMKTLHDLKEEDFIMGILYFGYTDKQPRLVRNIPMNEKIKWIE